MEPVELLASATLSLPTLPGSWKKSLESKISPLNQNLLSVLGAVRLCVEKDAI
jgi:hypothetical protein